MAEETITLKANSQYAVEIPGTFFAVLECTAPFKIEPDRGGKRSCSAGVKFSFAPFKRIMFFETAGADNVITFYAGDAQYDGTIPRVDDAVPVTVVTGIPFQVTGEPTFDYPYLMAGDGSQLFVSHAAPTLLPVQIAIAGSNYLRKSFHIANRTNQDIGLYATTGEIIDILQGNTDRTFTFSFDVNIQVLSGSSNANICLYYTLLSAPV